MVESKYVLIDGNNLAIRNSFSCHNMVTKNGVKNGLHYGFHRSLIKIKKQNPDAIIIIAWDGKSQRRFLESQKALNSGLIPSLYKANRLKGDLKPDQIKIFEREFTNLVLSIDYLGINQFQFENYEADDLIASFCKKFSNFNNEILIISSDRDYYQLLDYNIFIYDGVKKIKISKNSWEEENGLSINQFVSIGALCGDKSDNIFGIPGWTNNTAINELKKHKSIEKIYNYFEGLISDFRKKYSDEISGDMFNELKNALTKGKRKVWPQITRDLPYLGVAYALHKKNIEFPKKYLLALMFKDRVDLAYSLKKMDDNINLPELENKNVDFLNFEKYCKDYEIDSIFLNCISFFETHVL